MPDIVASGVSFDEALKRFKAGRPYSAKRAERAWSRRATASNGLEFFYALNIPDVVRSGAHATRCASSCTAASAARPTASARRRNHRRTGRRRADLHHSVRAGATRRGGATSRSRTSARCSTPSSAPTTSTRIASRVAGVSDGGTGAYYVAMRDTTPYASFLPLNGFIMVLPSVVRGGSVPEQSSQQAVLRRQRRQRSVVSDADRRAVRRAPEDTAASSSYTARSRTACTTPRGGRT